MNVYLFESVYHDMRTEFKELDTEYYAAHGQDLSKNKDFFNAVFRAGFQSPQLKEERNRVRTPPSGTFARFLPRPCK